MSTLLKENEVQLEYDVRCGNVIKISTEEEADLFVKVCEHLSVKDDEYSRYSEPLCRQHVAELPCFVYMRKGYLYIVHEYDCPSLDMADYIIDTKETYNKYIVANNVRYCSGNLFADALANELLKGKYIVCSNDAEINECFEQLQLLGINTQNGKTLKDVSIEYPAYLYRGAPINNTTGNSNTDWLQVTSYYKGSNYIEYSYIRRSYDWYLKSTGNYDYFNDNGNSCVATFDYKANYENMLRILKESNKGVKINTVKQFVDIMNLFKSMGIKYDYDYKPLPRAPYYGLPTVIRKYDIYHGYLHTVDMEDMKPDDSVIEYDTIIPDDHLLKCDYQKFVSSQPVHYTFLDYRREDVIEEMACNNSIVFDCEEQLRDLYAALKYKGVKYLPEGTTKLCELPDPSTIKYPVCVDWSEAILPGDKWQPYIMITDCGNYKKVKYSDRISDDELFKTTVFVDSMDTGDVSQDTDALKELDNMLEANSVTD